MATAMVDMPPPIVGSPWVGVPAGGGYQGDLEPQVVMIQDDTGGGLGMPSGVYMAPPPTVDDPDDTENYFKVLIFAGALVILNIIGLMVISRRNTKQLKLV